MQRKLSSAFTDYFYIDEVRQRYRIWVLGEKFLDSVIVMLEYNLTFQSLDVYLENGNMLRVFNVRDLFYEPYAEEEII